MNHSDSHKIDGSHNLYRLRNWTDEFLPNLINSNMFSFRPIDSDSIFLVWMMCSAFDVHATADANPKSFYTFGRIVICKRLKRATSHQHQSPPAKLCKCSCV